jgi:two-component sensor histidine kinase
VKNNLAVVSSLLRMKADAAGTREAKLALEESHQRVHAMSLIHEQLYESDHLDRIRFPMYAKQLINRLQHAFGTKTRVKIETHLDAIELGVEQAVPCGLILNELLTNAFKYAFPGGNRGKIVVSFHKAGEKALELAVEDNGIGLSAPLRAGSAATFGLRIVGILTNQLDGVLEHQPCPGTRIVLRFPMRSDVLSQN